MNFCDRIADRCQGRRGFRSIPRRAFEVSNRGRGRKSLTSLRIRTFYALMGCPSIETRIAKSSLLPCASEFQLVQFPTRRQDFKYLCIFFLAKIRYSKKQDKKNSLSSSCRLWGKPAKRRVLGQQILLFPVLQ